MTDEKKAKREEKVKRFEERMEGKLPAKFRDLNDEELQKKVETLEKEVSKVVEGIAPKQADLMALKKHLIKRGLGCQHEKLMKVGEKAYICEKCKKEIRVKIRD